MRRLLSAAVLAAAAAGCGGEKKFEPRQFSEEEKQKIQAEDKAVADEESHGTAGKAKGSKKAGR
jgi:hypothetical protein